MDLLQDVQPVYQGARFAVKRGKLKTENGKSVERDFVVHPGATVILPLIDQNHILLIRNQRYAVGKELWELPAGTLEINETPIETASRELIEETGYRAKYIEPLANFYTTPGFCNEKMYAFTAHELTFVGQALEENEHITVEKISWKAALDMIRKGVIEDAKTLLCLLHYKLFLE